jgi:hypothetical protein
MWGWGQILDKTLLLNINLVGHGGEYWVKHVGMGEYWVKHYYVLPNIDGKNIG